MVCCASQCVHLVVFWWREHLDFNIQKFSVAGSGLKLSPCCTAMFWCHFCMGWWSKQPPGTKGGWVCTHSGDWNHAVCARLGFKYLQLEIIEPHLDSCRVKVPTYFQRCPAYNHPRRSCTLRQQCISATEEGSKTDKAAHSLSIWKEISTEHMLVNMVRMLRKQKAHICSCDFVIPSLSEEMATDQIAQENHRSPPYQFRWCIP